MNENELPVVATQLDRMTVAPMVYDTIAIRYSAALPAGGAQAVTLKSQNYTLFSKGLNESSETVGMTITRDGLFTNLFNNGGMDKSARFEIWGVGIQFLGVPFIGTAGLDSGEQIQGTFINNALHGEYLAQLFLEQTYIEIGANQEDCVALAGPTAHWGFGGIGLGDNSVTPRMLNAIQGNDRRFRYALLAEPVSKNGSADITVRIKRSEKIALTYSTTTVLNAAAVEVAFLAQVVAFGRRV